MTRKPKSKRLTCKKKYKILKKIKEHKRKVRKSDKEKKFRKDPGIPNKHPFKLQLLTQLKDDAAKEKDMEKKAKDTKSQTLEELAADANKRNENFEELENNEHSHNIDGNFTRYAKEFHKVIDESNVIIHVLDARDPLGSRSKIIEDKIASYGPNKHLILLLNKIDLIPKDNTIAWLNYLRTEFPTVAFSAHYDSRFKKQLLLSNGLKDNCLSGFGISCLINQIKKLYANNPTVCVVGFPNVGKSSVINALKRSDVCKVAQSSGSTKHLQEVKIPGKITVIDCPGIVFPSETTRKSPITLITNCIRNQQITNPVEKAEILLNVFNKQQLKAIFEIPDFDTYDNFLHIVAKRFGKLKKGGIPDRNAAAKMILHYYSSGKIRFYVDPPTTPSNLVTSQIISDLKPLYDLNPMPEEELELFNDLTKNLSYVKLDLNNIQPAFSPVEMEDVEMAVEEVIKHNQNTGPNYQLAKNKKVKVSTGKNSSSQRSSSLREMSNRLSKKKRRLESRMKKKSNTVQMEIECD